MSVVHDCTVTCTSCKRRTLIKDAPFHFLSILKPYYFTEATLWKMRGALRRFCGSYGPKVLLRSTASHLEKKRRNLRKVSTTQGELLDNQRAHHPEHTVRRFGVRQDVAVERPHTRLLAIDDGIITFAGRDIERVGKVRAG